MASAERTRGMLEGAGFTAVRIEEVPVRFSFDDLDEWEQWAAELEGMEMVLGGMSDHQHEAFRSELAEAFAPFAANGRYELPGVAVAAVAS